MNKDNPYSIPRFVFITVFVAHALFCYTLFFDKNFKRKKPIDLGPIKVAFKTIEKPQPVVKKQVQTPAPKPKAQVAKTVAKPEPKKEMKKIEKKVEPKEVAKVAIAKELSKVTAPPKEIVKSETIEIPKSIEGLHIEKKESTEQTELTSVEREYQSQLIHFLESSLILPREGKISVEITLDKEGNLIKHEVKKVSDKSTETFIQNQLKSLRFPPFHHELSKEKQHTFLLTFSSK